MCNIVILFVHLIVTVVRLARPGGLRSVVAESLLLKHQLCILNRGRKRAPNLHRRAYHRRFVHFFHEPGTRSTFRHRPEAFHSAASAPRSGEAKVPHVVFAQAQAPAWPERTESRAH
jgi:hypothetical protein